MCVSFHSSHALTLIRPTNPDSHKDGVLIWNLVLKWKNIVNMRNIWSRSTSRKRRVLVLAPGHVWRKKELERQTKERERKTYVLQAVMAWHVSPVQNSEIVLYCRFMRLKKVVAENDERKVLKSDIWKVETIALFQNQISALWRQHF